MPTGALIVLDGQFLTVVDLIRFVLDWDERRTVKVWELSLDSVTRSGELNMAPGPPAHDVDCCYKLLFILRDLANTNIGIRRHAWSGYMVVNAEVFRAWARAWRRAWVVETLCQTTT